ncbi:hypothetical protein WME76_24135 [Sorangium sp. So ce119]|uniref:hypothetical protein n=1 Tax=Sorangium sp. So ce119 TaxID=3133279 RepID=UPI003F60E30F
MNPSQVANLFGASIFLVAAAAHAQAPAPAGGQVPPAAAPPPAAAAPAEPAATPAPADAGMTQLPTGTQAPATPPPPPGAPLAAAAPPPAPPAEVTKPAGPAAVPVTSKWKATVYGMAEFNIMHDSTQSFGESVGATVIQREDTYAGSHGRTHFTTRNSRFGIRASAPEFAGMKTTANLELDFFGNQPPTVSEASLVSSGTFRLRQANIKVESDYVDLMIGQFYHLFGWQPFFFPATVSFFPVMNQVFGRMPQLRVGHTFKTDPVNLEIAAAAVKPPQRDAEVPDLQAALRFGINDWKGIHTLGAAGMLFDPLTIGVSGIYRHFRVPEFSAAPVASRSADGYGISVDAVVPIIPVTALEEPGNALTLTGSFFAGTGIADIVGVAGNVPQPALPDGAVYAPGIDNGLVVYDANGNLKTIGWKGFVVGLQYYLPPSGRISISGNYTQGWNDRVTEENGYGALRTAYHESRYIDGNVFIDVTPAVRTGLSFQHSEQTFADGVTATNERLELAIYSFF